MKADPGNIPLWWARCDLLEKTGDKKRAMEGYQQILNLLPKDNGEKYLQLARDMTKVGAREGPIPFQLTLECGITCQVYTLHSGSDDKLMSLAVQTIIRPHLEYCIQA